MPELMPSTDSLLNAIRTSSREADGWAAQGLDGLADTKRQEALQLFALLDQRLATGAALPVAWQRGARQVQL